MMDGYFAPLLIIFPAAILIILRFFYRQRSEYSAEPKESSSINPVRNPRGVFKSTLEPPPRKAGRGIIANGIKTDIFMLGAVIGLTVVILLAMGRAPWYKNGPIRIWSGDVKSDQNSQQISDPYTFTHIIHGLGFYGILRLAPGPLSLGLRAIIAVSAESAWEVLENTDMVINRYRAETISLDYYGDSVVNSVFDILASIVGFLFAAKFSARASIILLVVIEIVLAFWIRDNLSLNILMLIYPLEAIKNWQMAL